MAATKQLISTVTVGAGGAASISFSSIPNTFTDLLLVMSARTDRASFVADEWITTINGSTASFTTRTLFGSGSSVASGTYGPQGILNASTATANTFSNIQAYFVNYSGSTNKPFSVDSVSETNATTAYQNINATLWSNTAAITSLAISSANAANFLQYTSASLYGITSGNGGATVS